MLRIAPDTNLLRATAARRFLCALVEQQGGRIVVLPTAREEGAKQIGLAAREDVIRLLRVKPVRDPAQATSEIMAADAAARRWWTEEERSNDSPFEFVDPARSKTDRYLARQTVLGPECHRDRGEAVVRSGRFPGVAPSVLRAGLSAPPRLIANVPARANKE